jgi:hypothetical protein
MRKKRALSGNSRHGVHNISEHDMTISWTKVMPHEQAARICQGPATDPPHGPYRVNTGAGALWCAIGDRPVCECVDMTEPRHSLGHVLKFTTKTLGANGCGEIGLPKGGRELSEEVRALLNGWL